MEETVRSLVRYRCHVGLALVMALLSAPVSGQSFSDVQFPDVQYRKEPYLPLIAFQQGRAEEDGRKADTGNLWARLALQQGRAPMVLLMHGCGGVGNGPTQDWIKSWGAFFWRKGFAVMAIDSFTSRAVKSTCGAPDEHWSYRRRDDANPARFCVEMGRNGDPNLAVQLFPGVFHGFDDGSRHRQEFGWRMGGDAKATEQVRQAIDTAVTR
jgi:dienelactone hydrolase